MMSVPGDPSLSFLLLLLFGHLAHSLLCIVYFGGSFLDPGFSSCARKGKQSTPDPFSLFLSRREAILSSSAGRTILPPQQQGRDFFAPLQISFLAPPAFSICSVLFLLARKKRNTESGIYGKSRSEKNKRLSLTPRPTTNRAGGKSPTSVAFPFHVPKQRKLLCVLSPPKKSALSNRLFPPAAAGRIWLEESVGLFPIPLLPPKKGVPTERPAKLFPFPPELLPPTLSFFAAKCVSNCPNPELASSVFPIGKKEKRGMGKERIGSRPAALFFPFCSAIFADYSSFPPFPSFPRQAFIANKMPSPLLSPLYCEAATGPWGRAEGATGPLKPPFPSPSLPPRWIGGKGMGRWTWALF